LCFRPLICCKFNILYFYNSSQNATDNMKALSTREKKHTIFTKIARFFFKKRVFSLKKNSCFFLSCRVWMRPNSDLFCTDTALSTLSTRVPSRLCSRRNLFSMEKSWTFGNCNFVTKKINCNCARY